MHRKGKSKQLIILVIIALLVAFILMFASAMNSFMFFNRNYEIEEKAQKYTDAEIEIGHKGYVSSAIIVQRKTRYGSF